MNKFENLSAEQIAEQIVGSTPEIIAEAILEHKITIENLRDTNRFHPPKPKKVMEKLNELKEQRKAEATKAVENQKRLDDIRKDIKNKTPKDIKELPEELQRKVCEEIGLDYNAFRNYAAPILDIDSYQLKEGDIPIEYTDVFFWGTTTSGKTCALAAILNTINKYGLEDPKNTKRIFGRKYRNSLISLFSKVNGKFGYLPGSTPFQLTQYMPFVLKDRKISFFELSGEVYKLFKYIIDNDIHNVKDVTVFRNTNGKILTEDEYSELDETAQINYQDGLKNVAFNTLNLLLKSDNKKIHFFFIDYNQDPHQQAENLAAAETYFRDFDDIFKKKTDAVYVIVTKADEIEEAANDKEKSEIAKKHLEDNFPGFIEIIKKRCKEHNINYISRIFSIGDVYLNKICKINKTYSDDIINELLKIIQPELPKWKKPLFKFFNG